MPQTIFKSVVVSFQFRDGREGDACKSETCPFPHNFINKGHLALKARVEIKNVGRGYGFRWIHRHWCCLTGLQIGGVRSYLRGGVPNAEYDWSLLMGLNNLPDETQNIVKLAVFEGEVQAPHKVNNLMGEPTVTGVHKRRAEAQTKADTSVDEVHDENQEGSKKEEAVKDEHTPMKAAGVIRKGSELAGLPTSPRKDRVGRQLKGGRDGTRARDRGGAQFFRGKAAQYRDLPVCHFCQSNAHAHKDCPKTRTNKRFADLGAFAPGLLPQNVARDLSNDREAEPSDNEEVVPYHKASVSAPKQRVSLFSLPSDYCLQGEIRSKEAIEARAPAPASESSHSSSTPAFMDHFVSFDMKLKKQAFTKVKKEQTLSLMGEDDLLRMPPKKRRTA